MSAECELAWAMAERLLRSTCVRCSALVPRVLARNRIMARAAGIELTDAVQEMSLKLLEQDGNWLRSWDPARGMSLPNWIGFLCERALRTLLWQRARFVGTAGNSELALDRVGIDPLHTLEARDELKRIVGSLGDKPSQRKLELLEELCLAPGSGAQVAASMGTTRSAVYSARWRLAKRTKLLASSPSCTSTTKARVRRCGHAS